MKDEEMAEEYANNIDYTKTVKIFDCVPYHENCDVADMVAQAFLAGLKAGRPQWHYMKDGKYPKEKQLVMVYRVNPLGANIAITNWYDSYKDTKVIAWKEIVLPELKESE